MPNPDAYSRMGTVGYPRAPKWRRVLYGFRDAWKPWEDEQTQEAFERSRDAAVEVLRNSDWVRKDHEEYDDLWCAIDDLKDSPDADVADEALWTIYNMADDERVWIALEGETPR